MLVGGTYSIKKESASHYNAGACIGCGNGDNNMEGPGRRVLQGVADARVDKLHSTRFIIHTLDIARGI